MYSNMNPMTFPPLPDCRVERVPAPQRNACPTREEHVAIEARLLPVPERDPTTEFEVSGSKIHGEGVAAGTRNLVCICIYRHNIIVCLCAY